MNKHPKTFKLTALFGLILSLFTSVANAQTPGESVLWKVSGKGLTKPSYLFGTIHINCDSAYTDKASIKSAIKACDYVITELNLTSYDELVKMYKASMDSSFKPLKSIYTAKEYQLIDSVSNALLGRSAATLNGKSLMGISMMFYTSPSIMGCTEMSSIDMQITNLARIYGKQVDAFETFDFQDSILKSISEKEQAMWLLDFCKDINRGKADFKKMMALYKAYDLAGLYKHLMTSPEMKTYEDLMLNSRNAVWIEIIKANIKEIPMFVAVGAGHLGGQNGLIQLLRSAGYTVTAVPIK